MKRILGVLGLLFLAGLAIVFGMAAAYLNGQGFRSFLSRKVAQGIGIEGHFSSLQFRGLAIGSSEFSGVGGPGSPFAELRAERLQARFPLASLVQGDWKIDPLRIGHLALTFRSASLEEKPVLASTPLEERAAEGGPGEEPGILRRVSLQRGEIQRADLRWPSSILGGGALTETRILLEADGASWNGKAGGGKLACASLPDLTLEELLFRFDRDGASLERGLLHSEGSGTIRLAGRVDWRERADGELRFSTSGVALTPWLPAAWRNRVAGELEAEGRLTGSRGQPWKVDANLSLMHGKLEDLPWLVGLALSGGGTEALLLDQAQAQLVAGPEELVFERIEIEAKGRLRIEGNLRVQGEQLSGKMMVGLSGERVALLPGAQEKIFSEERNGYLWTPVVLTGTVRDPREDLSPRVSAVAKEAVKAGVQRAIRSALDFLRHSQDSSSP
ncbi:hypothetical protein [Methylacidimicrobium tartarophylax]|uniref:AsmA-like C-terminal domain-containing protein n=1 Tax=Methylacidimicrobium tartarophylax TaxID=1041768 RepID=A0A5E6MGY2_9BACT|nr:hypothetical protein [Methylacidimicrobium tartarophylax]VVM07477.1 hypothetical protein MAMT_01761 [Methylacidimicrobium tartarophylax]